MTPHDAILFARKPAHKLKSRTFQRLQRRKHRRRERYGRGEELGKDHPLGAAPKGFADQRLGR